MAWKHDQMWVRQKGRIIVCCRTCDKRSPKLASNEDARDWWAEHTGLREKQPKLKVGEE